MENTMVIGRGAGRKNLNYGKEKEKITLFNRVTRLIFSIKYNFLISYLYSTNLGTLLTQAGSRPWTTWANITARPSTGFKRTSISTTSRTLGQV